MNIINEWDTVAEKYMQDQEQSRYVEINKNIVKNKFKNLKDKKVLDLGCGYGVYTNYFQSIGADALGVDGSEKMLALAKNNYPNCKFQNFDLSKKLPIESESYDLIFCNQVLMDIEDINLVFSEVQRILKKNGIFFYSIVHPVFYGGEWLKNENDFCYARIIQNYLKPYNYHNLIWGETMHFHRSLSYYLNIASNNGLMLINAIEPVSYDNKKKTEDIPLFFTAEYKKI